MRERLGAEVGGVSLVLFIALESGPCSPHPMVVCAWNDSLEKHPDLVAKSDKGRYAIQ